MSWKHIVTMCVPQHPSHFLLNPSWLKHMVGYHISAEEPSKASTWQPVKEDQKQEEANSTMCFLSSALKAECGHEWRSTVKYYELSLVTLLHLDSVYSPEPFHLTSCFIITAAESLGRRGWLMLSSCCSSQCSYLTCWNFFLVGVYEIWGCETSQGENRVIFHTIFRGIWFTYLLICDW